MNQCFRTFIFRFKTHIEEFDKIPYFYNFLLKEQQLGHQKVFENNCLKLEKHFKRNFEELQSKKQEVRFVQKKYFKVAQKHLKEKEYFKNNYEKALSKTKLNELRSKKYSRMKEYEKVFLSFKELFQHKNSEFEKYSTNFIELDTKTKKEICLSWDLLSTKLIEDIELLKVKNNKWSEGQINLDIQDIFCNLLNEKNKNKNKNKQEEIKNLNLIQTCYFDIKELFLQKFNNFSLFFLDYEFKNLKKCAILELPKSSDKLYEQFHIKKQTMVSKDIKLIEELILALHINNEFFYSNQNYKPAKLMKSISNLISDSVFSSKNSFSKLQNTKKRLRKLGQKIETSHFAFEYLFLYLYSKDCLFKINKKSIELLEEYIIAFIPNIANENSNNFLSICHILLCVYHLYIFDLKRTFQNISALTKTRSTLQSSKGKFFKSYQHQS